MKKAIMTLAAVTMMFSLSVLNGCTRQGMNEPMNSSMDTMQEEKMDTGKESMQEKKMLDSMNTMEDKAMEKSMDKPMK